MSQTSKKEASNPYNIYYDNYLDTDACTECTGLMPTPAVNFDERENYQQVFNYTRELFLPENHNGNIHSD